MQQSEVKKTGVEKDTIFCWTSDNKFKIVLVGDSGVGKTSIFWQYIEEFFPEDVSELKVTMVDFKIKNIVVDNELIKLYIWDTAGQERYRALVSNYFKGTHGIILIFDLGNQSSFESIKESWLQLAKDKSSDAILILVGNKSDLKVKKVDQQKVQQFASQNNLPYFEVSAFEGTNINEAFDRIACDIKHKFFKKESDSSKQEDNSVDDRSSTQIRPKLNEAKASIALKAAPPSHFTNNKNQKQKDCNC